VIYTELIYRTVAMAQRGGTNFEAANLDAAGMAEAQMPVVLQAVAENAAADPRKRGLLKQTVSVNFTNGVGTIPSFVLTKWMEDSTLFDPADTTVLYSWVRNFSDFTDPGLRQGIFAAYAYYSIVGGDSMVLTLPGVGYSPSSGFTGSRSFNAPTVPTMPATANDVLNIVDEIISDIIETGAEMLRGKVAKEIET
jgi:hypothetical protein